MISPEDRLRTALRNGTPPPLDAETIMTAARRRRTLGIARVGAVAAALVLVLVGGWRIVGLSARETAEPRSATPSTAGAPAAPAPAERADASTVPGGVRTSNTDIIPGRTLLVFPERWCVVGSSDGREIGCTARSQHVQRVADEQDVEWLVLLAPSGRDTAVLQVEQRASWVTMRSSSVRGANDLWVGVLRSAEVPEEPRDLRALNASGQEIWSP